ncbi:STAS domain-containing protein [Aliiruegeria haliotis]|uniref:STAS domain-containing protein n=1 Tax=Aliiruegeria haliotis TaxID=1280846 RepID=A0A2T0S0N9_9RHOB|nr:STAS domain-containing protein [Aliiruegeria haliotis]PRY26994.1 STAS domain-containing protein [Aliiruegeria haliotis]
MSARYALPERLDLPAAAPIADALKDLVGDDLELDASGVRQVGTPGLQVLLSARRSWGEAGRRLTLCDPSEALVEQLSILGLAPEALTTSPSEE